MNESTNFEVLKSSHFPSSVWKDMVFQGQHRDVAHAFHSLFGSQWVYCKKAKCWYKLQENNTWAESDTLMMSTQLDYLRRAVSYYEHLVKLADRPEELKALQLTAPLEEKQLDAVHNLYKNLGKADFRKQVVKETTDLYAKEDFTSELDSKLNLFAFTDKVVDLDTGIVSKISPYDRVLTTCGYPYPEGVSTEKALKYFKSLFPTEEEAVFNVKTLAYMLHGDKSRLDHFFCWIGNGGNGKSSTCELVERVFGDYYSPIDITYFTSKKANSSSQATPELENKKGKRVVVTTEPEQDDKLNLAKFKKLSDTMEVRGLYKSPVKFKAQFGVVVLTNSTPTFTSSGDSLARRFLAQNFPLKFCENPTKENERPTDPNLKQWLRSEELRNSCMALLLQYHEKYLTTNPSLNPPAQVKLFTGEINEDNDVVGNFVKSHLTFTNNSHDKVRPTELYEHFKYTTGSEMTLNTFGKSLPQELKSLKKKDHYVGVKLDDGSDGLF